MNLVLDLVLDLFLINVGPRWLRLFCYFGLCCTIVAIAIYLF